MKKDLTPKEKIFVLEYLIDLDPQRAAIAAGFSKTMARSKAYQWVSNSKTKPHVYEAIQEKMKIRHRKAERSADEALDLVWKMAELDLANYMKVDDDGNVSAIPFSELPEGATRFINKIKQRKSSTKNKDGSREYEDVSIEYELPERTKCVDMLMKHYGLYTENHVLTGKDGKPIQVEEVGEVKKLTNAQLDSIIAQGVALGYFNPEKKKPGK